MTDAEYISFCDDEFWIKRERSFEIIEKLYAIGIKFYNADSFVFWGVFRNVNLLNRNHENLLRCQYISLLISLLVDIWLLKEISTHLWILLDYRTAHDL